MLAAYGVDVLDPRVTPRRLAVLAGRLPPAALRGGQAWSTEAELLALVVDHLARLTWVTLRAHGAKGAARPRPLPRPALARPGAGRQAAARTGPGRGQSGRTWADTAAQLALIPGVRVEHDG
jgi:hypothetical protein